MSFEEALKRYTGVASLPNSAESHNGSEVTARFDANVGQYVDAVVDAIRKGARRTKTRFRTDVR